MGKTKKTKLKVKDSPTGLPSVRDISLQEELLGPDETGSRSLQAVIEQIQAPTVEDKLCGLQTLATLFKQPVVVQEILEACVARMVGPLLVDPSSDVRYAAAGALRNLSISGGEVCDILVEQDVLTPLFALFQEYYRTWTPVAQASVDGSPGSINSDQADTFVQAVHLIWNLCESSPRALELVTQVQLIPLLARALDIEVYGQDIAIGVAQCLQVISEDNPAALEELKPAIKYLHRILHMEGDDFRIVLLRTLASSIIINVSEIKSPHMSKILTTLSSSLTPDHRAALGALSSALPLGEHSEEQSLTSEHEKHIQQVEYLLEAQKTAVEVLTNICSNEDTEEDTMDCDGSDNEGSDYEDVNSETGSGIILGLDKLPVEIIEAVGSLRIVDKVWACAQPLAENVDAILQEHETGRSLLKKVAALHYSALLCLHNLTSCLPLDLLGGPEALRSVWLSLGHQVFRGSRGDETHLEAVTAMMRAALERLRQGGTRELWNEVSENDVKLMLDGEQHCVDSEVRANWLRMLGLLGPLLAPPLSQRIASFLLEVCFREALLWPLAEALDALIDMFSEDDTDGLAKEVGLVEKLTALVPVLKNKMRQQKRKLGDRAPAVSTICTNLPRFIKYKRGRLLAITANGK